MPNDIDFETLVKNEGNLKTVICTYATSKKRHALRQSVLESFSKFREAFVDKEEINSEQFFTVLRYLTTSPCEFIILRDLHKDSALALAKKAIKQGSPTQILFQYFQELRKIEEKVHFCCVGKVYEMEPTLKFIVENISKFGEADSILLLECLKLFPRSICKEEYFYTLLIFVLENKINPAPTKLISYLWKNCASYCFDTMSNKKAKQTLYIEIANKYPIFFCDISLLQENFLVYLDEIKLYSNLGLFHSLEHFFPRIPEDRVIPFLNSICERNIDLSERTNFSRFNPAAQSNYPQELRLQTERAYGLAWEYTHNTHNQEKYRANRTQLMSDFPALAYCVFKKHINWLASIQRYEREQVILSVVALSPQIEKLKKSNLSLNHEKYCRLIIDYIHLYIYLDEFRYKPDPFSSSFKYNFSFPFFFFLHTKIEIALFKKIDINEFLRLRTNDLAEHFLEYLQTIGNGSDIFNKKGSHEVIKITKEIVTNLQPHADPQFVTSFQAKIYESLRDHKQTLPDVKHAYDMELPGNLRMFKPNKPTLPFVGRIGIVTATNSTDLNQDEKSENPFTLNPDDNGYL